MDILKELAQALGNDKNFSALITNSLATKALLNNPTFTGTVLRVSKAMVNLASVDDTRDLAKPKSTATHNALDAKQNKFILGGYQAIQVGYLTL